MGKGNPSPTYSFKSDYPQPIAVKPVSLRLSKEDDEYVRSLPQRTDWLRKVIEKAIAEEKANAS